jgi:chemotaxis-related protein WspB
MLLLTLKAGTNRYAINVARVIELVPRVELTSVPHAPPFLAGLLPYRGNVIPVIDLGLLFSSVPCRDCLSTRIILVNDGPGDHNSGMETADRSSKSPTHAVTEPARNERLLGLIGEEVSDLTYIQPEQVAKGPVQFSQMSFLDEIVQTKTGIIQVIAVHRIRETVLSGDILYQGGSPPGNPLKCDVATLVREDSRAGV